MTISAHPIVLISKKVQVKFTISNHEYRKRVGEKLIHN